MQYPSIYAERRTQVPKKRKRYSILVTNMFGRSLFLIILLVYGTKVHECPKTTTTTKSSPFILTSATTKRPLTIPEELRMLKKEFISTNRDYSKMMEKAAEERSRPFRDYVIITRLENRIERIRDTFAVIEYKLTKLEERVKDYLADKQKDKESAKATI